MRIRHGYLYLADLSPRFGTEPGKLRPVVVIQSDLLNEADHPSTWIIPCTTRRVGESVLRTPLARGTAGNAQECEVMIDQSRAIDNRRFSRELGKIPAAIMSQIKRKIRQCGDL